MFLLAHLSDPHIGPLPRPRWSELASKRLFGYVNWRRRRSLAHRLETLDALTRDLAGQPHDHIAVTGDLVNLALPKEFAAAQAWLDRLGAAADVTFVPGNHDAYVRAALPYWDKHWSVFMRGDQGDPELLREPNATRFPFVRRRGPVALIGLSSAVPTLPLSAAGRLGREQIERAAGLLRQLGEEGLFRIVLLHHPPWRMRASPHKRLTDAASLRHAIALAGAELVLHGHDHRNALIWLDGPRGRIPAIGVPSASAAPDGHDEPASYNLYRIAGNPGSWTCEVVSRGFRPDAPGIAEIGRRMLSPDRQ